jgi:preprotein translocase subunit SecD
MRRSALFWFMVFATLLAFLAVGHETANANRPLVGTPGSKDNPLKNPCTAKPFATVMTGAGLESVTADTAGFANNEFVISFRLANNDEAEKFSEHTRTHRGQPMAIVLDGEVLSAPVIQSELTTGGQITGNFTREEAEALALQLQSGTLPASFDVESIDPNDNGVHVVFVTVGEQHLDPDQLDRTGEIIANRLQALGISDPVVNLEDDMHISVDLPSEPDPQTVIDVIRRPALLEFVDFSKPRTCAKNMPVKGQYVLTDVQVARQGGQSATAVATKAATKAATKRP